VARISKAAIERNLGQAALVILDHFLRAINAAREQIAVRRYSHRLLESATKGGWMKPQRFRQLSQRWHLGALTFQQLKRQLQAPVWQSAFSLDFSYPYYSKACGGACKRDFGGDEK
jgi:hypothetical protein